jgi:very-short-patch-repair endonuclease
MRLDQFDRLARAHHGLISKAASGLGEQAWRRAIRGGQLIQIHPGVARLVGTVDTPEQRIAAAVMALGPGTLASHRSAARLWNIPRPESDPVDVILPGRRPQRRLVGVIAHRPRDQADLSPPQRRLSIPCTNILRTMCDLGAVDAEAVTGAIGHVLSTKLADLPALELAMLRHAGSGRRGVSSLRTALDGWSIDSRPADSVLEPAMRRLVDRYGLPPVEFHAVIEGWEVDFRVTGTVVVLECDGWTSHGLEHRQFERDRLRDGRLTAAGWIVLRFTYRSIISTPRQTAGRIRQAIERWSTVAPPDAP